MFNRLQGWLLEAEFAQWETDVGERQRQSGEIIKDSFKIAVVILLI